MREYKWLHVYICKAPASQDYCDGLSAQDETCECVAPPRAWAAPHVPLELCAFPSSADCSRFHLPSGSIYPHGIEVVEERARVASQSASKDQCGSAQLACGRARAKKQVLLRRSRPRREEEAR